ncbi:hypothetical protein J2W28_004860 [Variovorax boronicumulans]|uniref:hypothetical protein n=1 Tax=Variovorax boronicumulans TaxID=436515 RepID=UPI00277ECBED|nr:hypothetical protein [Variovorax boronicumulans]MDP9989799.1 hypothetical protein [Variovorax boronicumulans]MDQ0005695.1 hypothetical protein [Variovorax boronicumulans]
MADQIIAGQNSPTFHDATWGPDASDILENKLTQLQSLLHCCYGDEQELFEAIGARHRGNLMWIGADLAEDIARLTQQLLKRLRVLDQQKA